MRTTLPVPKVAGKSRPHGGTFIVRSLPEGDEVIVLGSVDEWTVGEFIKLAERCNRSEGRRR
jgi:hypothetical protein